MADQNVPPSPTQHNFRYKGSHMWDVGKKVFLSVAVILAVFAVQACGEDTVPVPDTILIPS